MELGWQSSNVHVGEKLMELGWQSSNVHVGEKTNLIDVHELTKLRPFYSCKLNS